MPVPDDAPPLFDPDNPPPLPPDARHGWYTRAKLVEAYAGALADAFGVTLSADEACALIRKGRFEEAAGRLADRCPFPRNVDVAVMYARGAFAAHFLDLFLGFLPDEPASREVRPPCPTTP